MRTAQFPDKSHADPILRELGEIFARAYRRLLAAAGPMAELPSNLPSGESSPRSPNCLDVAAGPKHELDRRVRR